MDRQGYEVIDSDSTAAENKSLNKFRNQLKTFLIGIVIILHIIAILAVFVLVIIYIHLPSTAILITRVFQSIVTGEMFISSGVMLWKMYHWYASYNEAKTEDDITVSKGVVVFVLTLAGIAFSGYTTLLHNYGAFFENNEALDFIYRIEWWMDVIFILVFLIFLVIIVRFILAYATSYTVDKLTIWTLEITLIMCYVQKWVFETVIGYNHLCHEAHQEGGACNQEEPNFEKTLQNLSDRQQYLYQTMLHDAPFVYTITMELFPALFALLHHLTLHRREIDEESNWEDVHTEDGSRRNAEQSREGGGQESKNNERDFERRRQNGKNTGQRGGRRNENDDELADQHEQQEDHDTEKKVLIVKKIEKHDEAHHQNYIEYVESKEETIYDKIRNALLLILLAGGIISLTGYYFVHPILFPWYDDPDKKKDAALTNAIFRVCAHSFNSALYCLMLKNWKAEEPRPCTWCQWFKGLLPWNWNVFDLPDLGILQIACYIAIFTLGAKGAIHVFAYGFALFTKQPGILIGDISNIIMVFSYARQFKVIKRFLMFSPESYLKLRDERLFVWQAPFCIVSNLAQFAAVFAYKTSLSTPYPKNETYLFIFAIFESGAVGSFLFSVTAAVCWAQIVERVYEAGAYRVQNPTLSRAYRKADEFEAIISKEAENARVAKEKALKNAEFAAAERDKIVKTQKIDALAIQNAVLAETIRDQAIEIEKNAMKACDYAKLIANTAKISNICIEVPKLKILSPLVPQATLLYGSNQQQIKHKSNANEDLAPSGSDTDGPGPSGL